VALLCSSIPRTVARVEVYFRGAIILIHPGDKRARAKQFLAAWGATTDPGFDNDLSLSDGSDLRAGLGFEAFRGA